MGAHYQQLLSVVVLCLAVQNTFAARRVDLTQEQQLLLRRLHSETGLRGSRSSSDSGAGSSSSGGNNLELKFRSDSSGIPDFQFKITSGFGFPAGSKPVNVLPFFGSPDDESIDIFSWPWAAKMEDLVGAAGYPLENHKVVTIDGFILNLYRIPHGKYRNTEPGPRPVVFLQHGVTLASNSFVLLNANESMAYILADAGFDVWMGNSRGNTYSRGHKFLNQWGQRYWRYSMDDLALVDLPAQIDYILKFTGASKLAFVGHSQGCTLMYMLLSEKVEYNDKISVVVHVGPVAFIEFIRAPFLKAQPKIKSDQWLKNFPLGEFLANRDLAPFVMPFCSHNKTFNEWCAQQMNGMFYGPSVFIPTTDYLTVFTTWPSTVATRNLEHWAQMDQDGVLRLQKYSYGNDCTNLLRGAGFPRSFHESCNLAAYGTETPPEYDFSKITAPQAYFLGTIDLMSTPEDVAEQQRRLNPNVTVVQYVYQRYSHMDFVWDRNALYAADMADIMFRFAPGTF